LFVAPFHWLTDPPLYDDDIREYPAFRRGDTVIFQKVSGFATQSLLSEFKRIGVRTIYIDSDLPLKAREAALADVTVCSSARLCELYRDAGVINVHYIPDAIERSTPPRTLESTGLPLRCIWFGHAWPDRWEEVQKLRLLLEREVGDCNVVTVADCDMADLKWKLPTAWEWVEACDIAVFPTPRDSASLVKSSNRVVQAMALGLPVLASPMPAYADVIRNGRNGFLCSSPEEWCEAVNRLKDPRVRNRMACTAYRYATRAFSMTCIGRQWERLLCSTCEFGNALDDDPMETVRALWLKDLRARFHSRVAKALDQYVYLKMAYEEAASYRIDVVSTGNEK
jgi:glycosyltransferase involved in cell wall biosynthesis